MNFLDALVVLVVISAAVTGIRRGFVLGVYEIVLLIIGFIFAALTYRPVASLLDRVFDLQTAALNIIAFVVAILLFQMIASMTIGNIMRLTRRAFGFVPGVSTIDRIAGIVPGIVHGILLATLILLPIGYFTTLDSDRSALTESRLALPLYRESSNLVLRAATAAGMDLGDFVAITPSATDDGYVLPFKVTSGLEVAQSDEQRMFELVNEERAAAGLSPVEWDPELVPVARAHSQDMFENGYFSHYSPTTGSPFDRMNAAGIGYITAGENLALAPTVELAHDGLMDSPGHRANILEPSFGRMAIGAISAPGRGTMYTQLFRD